MKYYHIAKVRFVIALICTCLISGCFGDGDKREIKVGKYGRMGDETPQYAAIVFMLSIYENNDLNETLSMTNERFGQTLRSYHTNKGVQRHVLNLRLDNVEVEPMSGGFSPRGEFRETATVDVKITGTFDNDKIVDLKTVEMIKTDGNWQIVGVKNTVP